jgi:N-terminal acetyltransferase B complex non-catalytic subunit
MHFTNWSSYVSKVRDEVEAHLDPASGIDKSWRRNASLAWVKLAFEGAVESTAVTGESTKVDTVAKYLAVYGDAATAYNDLRPFVERLNAKEREVLLGRLHSASSDVRFRDD